MSSTQLRRTLTALTVLLLLAATAGVAVVVARRDHVARLDRIAATPVYSPDGTGLPVLYPAPDFTLTDQDGNSVSAGSLRGRPYVASFMFTHCAGICPGLTANLRRLQEATALPGTRMLSITVDPARDTPAVLHEYAARFNADMSRWSFLTGDPGVLRKVAAGLRVMPSEPMPGTDQMTHTEQVLLVDAEGRLRGAYDLKADGVAALAADAAKLAGAGGGR